MSARARDVVARTGTVHLTNVAQLSPNGRKKLSNWLRREAAAVVRDGLLYSSRYTARFSMTRTKRK